ncbi:hypothetical protein LXL04_007669 [Taraxacum kok-saghyz]
MSIVFSHPKSLEILLPPDIFKARSLNCHILNPFCHRIKDKADYAKRVMCLANAIDRLPISDSQTDDTTGEELSPELSNRYIRGLCKAGNIDRAMVYLSQMEALCGLCEQTVKVLQLMEHEGMEPNLIMLNVLINAFGIAGRHLEALSVYHHINESGVSPDVVTYTTLMKALLRAKEFKKVPVIYKDMETAGCSPDRKARELLQTAMMVLERRR